MLTDEQLEGLLRAGESDRLEFKRSDSDRSGLRKSICAFANDLTGHEESGVIVVGVKDDGSCAGLTIDDRLLQGLSAMRSDGNILPPPMISVEKRQLRGFEVAVIEVSPSQSPPVRYEGRVWVRIGPTNRVATAEEERRLTERQRSANLPFDYQPVADATLAELDMDFFTRQYLPSAVKPDVLANNHRAIEQQLASLRFANHEGLPTYGAILVFATDPRRWIPGAYVQFLRIDGKGLTDPILDQKELSGPLHRILVQLDELLEINITTAANVTTGRTEIRKPDYPLVALQQLTRNALMHRSYDPSTNAPSRLYWFKDRIEIHNPGGLFGQVNERNFGKGATDYRNPLIAEAMRVLGYVQRFGLGIPLARQELERNGNPPPQFQFRPENVLVIVRKAV